MEEQVDERASVPSGEQPPAARSGPTGLSVAISVAAVALAAAHLIWPRAKVDSVTVVLLVIALLPWLGVIFESIRMPGGWQFDYRKQLLRVETRTELVQARTDELQSQLHAVEARMFQITGVSASQELSLDRALREYADHLVALDLSLERDDLPLIEVDPELSPERPPGYYTVARNRIVLPPDALGDVTPALRQYTHAVLAANIDLAKVASLGEAEWGMPHPMGHLEDGLADYFVASYRDDPVLGRPTALRRGRPYFRKLSERADFDTLSDEPPSWLIPAENPWGSLFWAIRSMLGQERTDRLLAGGWVSTTIDKEYDRSFLTRLLEQTPESDRATVEALLRQRGAPF